MYIKNLKTMGQTLRIALKITIVFFLLAGAASALSGDGTWQYYRDITINNSGGAPLSDYQVMVNLTGADFPLRANTSGADIRFEQGGAELSYWIEKWDYVNASALVWVNVTDVPAGESMVRMWYGNPNATEISDVAATFKSMIDGGQPVVGSWNFDDDSGMNTHDSSGKGNDGILVNSPTWIDGKFGKALNFDGTNDYVNTADIDLPLTFTLHAWINPNNLTGYQNIMSKDDGLSERSYFFQFDNNGKLVASVKNNVGSYTQYRTNNIVLNQSQWQQVVMLYYGNGGENEKMEFYVNGANFAASFISYYDAGGTPADVSTTLKIGISGDGTSYPFNGSIDEVHIYNRALSSSEITDLYNNYGYTTTNYPGRVLVRKYTSPEPAISGIGAEILIGPVHNINTGKNYTTIQSAINDASAGDEIHVDSGIYFENVIVDRQLILRGIDIGGGMPVVDANGMGDAITIAAEGVVLDGFNANNSSSNNGIEVVSSNNVITNNNVSNNFYGILLSSGGNILISNTVIGSASGGIFSNYYPDNILINNTILSNGYGIYLRYSDNNTLADNRVFLNTIDGLTLDNSANNTVTNNNISSNTGNGVYLYQSIGNTFTDNILISNNYGFNIGYSDNNTFSSNTAILNANGGISFSSSHNNSIIDNINNNNGWGIYLSYSGNNTITGNEAISNSNIGITLGDSGNNTVTGNNVSSNAGIGIYLYSAGGNTLTDNILISNDYGFSIDYSQNNTLTGNTAVSNTNGGIYLGISSNNTIISNIEENNGWGIYLGSSGNNTITNNQALLNTNNGITLSASSDNVLINNNASSNLGAGIYAVSSARNTFKDNIVNTNAYGFTLDSSDSNILINNKVSLNTAYGIILSYSNTNVIYNNYFNNTNNALDDGKNIWNTTKTQGSNIIGGSWLGGNYWSDYSGIDTDGDGLGNTLVPYNSSANIALGGDYLPLTAASSSIVIYTDKTSYKARDKMYVGLNMTNPGSAQKVGIDIWIDLPGGGKQKVVSYPSAPLPAGFDWRKYPLLTLNLPNIPAGNYAWHAMLKNTTSGSIISESVWPWTFGSAAGSQVEIGTIMGLHEENAIINSLTNV